MYAASLPTPVTVADVIEVRKCRPTKYRPGSPVTIPRSCIGSPSSSKTGRSIQE